MRTDLRNEIECEGNVTVQLDGASLKFKGPQGEAERKFVHPKIKISLEGKKIILTVQKATRREKAVLGSYTAHVKNLLKGVQELHTYKLKICSGHFPMNVSVSGTEFIIKNFFGESVPRKVSIIKGADVKVNGTEIVVTSTNKEIAGQMAASIESLCRITNRDLRIFQDGCYIVEKAGKSLS